ncbi:MAG: aryl-sulfate sulfotransferase [Cellulosilyticaceae bacterium]
MSNQVQVKEVKHLIKKQYEAEQAFLNEFAQGEYTVEKPLIKLNPYIVAPLTALIMFRTEEAVGVTVTVKGKEIEGDVSHRFESCKEHYIPVLGLYGDMNNTVEIQLETGEVHTVKIETPELAEGVKLPTKMETTSEYMKDNMMFVTSAMKSTASAYDYKGDCRWYTTENFTFDMKRISNGRILIGSERFLEKPYNTVGIVEMSLLGKIYVEYRLPGGYHHDKWEMEDGNILILTQDFSTGTVEDMCVLVDRQTGDILKVWDYKEWLPQEEGKSGSWSEDDWFHNNALWYDKNTHTLTFSGRHQDILINVDYETGKLNWMLGDPEGWPQELVDKYFFTPVGDKAFDWHYEPHACVITAEGDVMVFDNGHFRSKNPEKYLAGVDNFSRGVRYHINTEDMTIEQVWQYGKERGKEFFSPYISNVEYYADGHYLVHSGGIAEENGVTVEGIGSRAALHNPNIKLSSTTVEILNDEVVFEMQLAANYYRAEKMPLYDERDTLTFGEGKLLGGLGVTQEFETAIEGAVEVEGGVPEKYKITFDEEEDRYVFRGTFEKGQLVMLLLEGEENVHRYYISTSASEKANAAMCVGVFQSTDERVVSLNINKEGLENNLIAKIIIDMEQFDLGVTLKCIAK